MSRTPPLPPEVLADAMQDRIHPTSGRLLSSSPILKATAEQDRDRGVAERWKQNSASLEG